MRIACSSAAVLLLALVACSGDQAPTPAVAMPAASAAASTTVGGATLQASTVAIADLNATVAGRYGIDLAEEGVLLLVTVRDSAGNGIDPGDLRLTATAGTLAEAPKPLDLRAISTDGMTDYIGVFRAVAPASVHFRLSATRSGARADIGTTAELQPR
ncbi:MAG: DUF4426 domain-containing protein [Thermomonas sp.]|nr:DUF4426 domain-containing protein [Thermomonas sp.]